MVQPQQSLGNDELLHGQRAVVGEDDPLWIDPEPLEAVQDEGRRLPAAREGMEEEVVEVGGGALVEDPERRERLGDEVAVVPAHEVAEIHPPPG